MYLLTKSITHLWLTNHIKIRFLKGYRRVKMIELIFKDRQKFNKKLKELDKMKASYYVDMVCMAIWDIVLPEA